MVVNSADQVLLVRGTFGPQQGRWHFPGGKVEPGELVHAAAIREVREEAGVDAEVIGLAAVRHRLIAGQSLTPVYLIFLMRARDDRQQPCPDATECDAAAYFDAEEIERLPNILDITRAVALRHLRSQALVEANLPGHSGHDYVLFT